MLRASFVVNVDHHWEQHRRCNDQAAQWQRDGALVELRDLKYKYRYGADRQPILDINGKKIPVAGERPKEKGIEPVRYAKIETVSWFNRRHLEENTLSGGPLVPTTPRRIWNTNLDRACFDAARDRNDYR